MEVAVEMEMEMEEKVVEEGAKVGVVTKGATGALPCCLDC